MALLPYRLKLCPETAKEGSWEALPPMLFLSSFCLAPPGAVLTMLALLPLADALRNDMFTLC